MVEYVRCRGQVCAARVWIGGDFRVGVHLAGGRQVLRRQGARELDDKTGSQLVRYFFVMLQTRWYFLNDISYGWGFGTVGVCAVVVGDLYRADCSHCHSSDLAGEMLADTRWWWICMLFVYALVCAVIFSSLPRRAPCFRGRQVFERSPSFLESREFSPTQSFP